MWKRPANYITLSRMLLAISLLFIINNKNIYLIIYMIAWVTDAIDGPVARLTKTQSDFGSKLDDIADTMLGAIMGISVFVWLGTDLFIYLAYASVLIIIRIFNVFYTKYKYGKVYVIHTYGNKATSFIAFLIPISYLMFDSNLMFYVVIIVGTLASLEESIIHISHRRFSHKRRSIFISIPDECVEDEEILIQQGRNK